MEKTESSVFLRWEPDQFRRLLLRDAETNRAKESFEADSITLKVKMFTLLTLMNTTKPFWQFSTIHAKSGRYLRYISAIFFGFFAKF